MLEPFTVSLVAHEAGNGVRITSDLMFVQTVTISSCGTCVIF